MKKDKIFTAITTALNNLTFVEMLLNEVEPYFDMLGREDVAYSIMNIEFAHKRCKMLMERIAKACPECNGTVEGGVCQTASCKGRLQ